MQHVEAFTAGGVMSGTVRRGTGLRDELDAEQPIDLERATWYPIDGGRAEQRSKVHLGPDDLLVVCAETEELPIHASWHAVDLVLGPYHVTGDLPTLPGFDPGRALARPGGPFILLRDARVELAGHSDGGTVSRPQAFVNRYAVERVTADLELGFYFPGAGFPSLAG
jgi:hypothetical protein